jgi:tetratricopeptide (TPR) repeat protein
VYHNELSRVFTQVVVGLAENKDTTQATEILPYAIKESDIAFAISPRNINIRESRISMYLLFSQFDVSYLQNSIDLINETILLSPTDPKLPLLLGKTYANMGKINLAIDEFKKALALKPDYEEAQKDLQIVLKIQNKK